MNTNWLVPEDSPALSNDEVHVWRIRLDLDEAAAQSLYATLSPGERERADFFRFQKDRTRFITARSTLRILLARYLNRSASDLRFLTNERGKPYLEGGKLRFNVSHSHLIALIAVTRSREVGVDLEYLRAGLLDEHIAEHYFSPAEVNALHALPEHLQEAGFFNCWTRKEAYIKAVGQGLSIPLDSFEVSLAPGSPAALLATRPDPQEAGRWSMVALHPGPGYAGALAVQGRDLTLRCWQWPGHPAGPTLSSGVF